jgi:putative molybdopterin biosynthesis protein
MQSFQRLQLSSQLKLLADPRRLAILRNLMADPATLTQLGEKLGEHPAWIRHHLMQLETAGIVELSEERVSAGHVEKYYRACARTFLIHEWVLPGASDRPMLVLSGSHDLALELLAEMVSPVLDLLILPIGSLDGLVALRQGLCQAAGCHLYDSPSGEYNLPYLRHFFPDQPATLVALAYRQQGLMVAVGNPHKVRGLTDLTRLELTFINRNRGSGTRLWLDEQLHRLGVLGQQVHGYRIEVSTHTLVAEAVRCGQADLGLGVQAAAKAGGLDFVPLFQERFDLAFLQEHIHESTVTTLLDHLYSGNFRKKIGCLEGYEASITGQQWQVV